MVCVVGHEQSGECRRGSMTWRESLSAGPGRAVPEGALQGATLMLISGGRQRKAGDAVQDVVRSAAALLDPVGGTLAGGRGVDGAVGAGTSSVTCGDSDAMLGGWRRCDGGDGEGGGEMERKCRGRGLRKGWNGMALSERAGGRAAVVRCA